MNEEPAVRTSSRLSEEHKQRLLLRAKSGRSLSISDVREILNTVDVDPGLLEDINKFLVNNKINFDSSSTEFVPNISDADDIAMARRSRRRKDPARLLNKTRGLDMDPMKVYLREIGEVDLLTAELEVSLAKQIEAGEKASKEISDLIAEGEWTELTGIDRRRLRRLVKEGDQATNELTSANLRLVVSIAKRYLGRGLPILDLVQEGNLGLMRAVQKFDYSKGFKFSTYATWWIRQAVTRALADQSRTIRVPIHMVESMNRVSQVKRALDQKLEREATIAEIAEECDMTEQKVTEILQIIKQDPLSLDAPVGTEDATSMADFIPDSGLAPVELAARSMLRSSVDEVLDALTDREADVLRLRFGIDDGRPRTLEEVGKAFGVTRERIRQIESRTLAKLRHPLRSDGLKDYLS